MHKRKILKIIAFILIQAFLTMDLGWVSSNLFASQQDKHSSTLAPRVYIDIDQFQHIFQHYLSLETRHQERLSQADLPATLSASSSSVSKPESFIRKFIERLFSGLKRLFPENELIGNIASGNWNKEHHQELNAQIRDLIGKEDTDLSEQYPVKIQKEKLANRLKEFLGTLSGEERERFNIFISDTGFQIKNIEDLFNKLQQLLNSDKTNFYYLKPSRGVFYLKRNGLPPLIAEAHFGHGRKSKKDKKEKNNVYIAEPWFKLKTEETQQAVLLHELIHLAIGAGDKEHEFASRLQAGFERFLLEQQVSADFLNKYKRYYELKSEIQDAEKADNNVLYQQKREELINLVDELRTLTGTVPYEQFKKAFELLKLNQIENQEDAALILGSFDEFYHLSSPDYNEQELEVIREIAKEVSVGFKKWHDQAEIYKQAMKAMKPFHIKNLLPESIDEKNKQKRQFLSIQVKSIIQTFSSAKTIGACFSRGLDSVSVLTKGLRNRTVSVPFLKASIKHELVHYFGYKRILPIKYDREDITTAITVIELFEHEGMSIFDQYQDFFTPVGEKLFEAGRKLQQEGKVFLDEEYLLKTAFEIFKTDQRTEDKLYCLCATLKAQMWMRH